MHVRSHEIVVSVGKMLPQAHLGEPIDQQKVTRQMKLLTFESDHVVGGSVISAVCSYGYALDKLLPLVKRLDIQRNTLKTKFYSRLERDIVGGCVMPPITVALVGDADGSANEDSAFKYIVANIQDAFVLDGIQRLSTLAKASADIAFDPDRPLFVNFVIAGSRDRLLYRMITLNNGQRPMSARHQIEILADSFFDFDDVGLPLVAEKKTSKAKAPKSFKKSDFVKGYIAYLSDSVNVDNQKIIEDKMDELIASRIIDSDIPSRKIEFADVVEFVNRISENKFLNDWIRIQNNFIGFCVGSKGSIQELSLMGSFEIEAALLNFERAMDSINASKVNVGRVRREVVAKYVEKFVQLKDAEEYELLDLMSGWI